MSLSLPALAGYSLGPMRQLIFPGGNSIMTGRNSCNHIFIDANSDEATHGPRHDKVQKEIDNLTIKIVKGEKLCLC